ncbi:hypothetical protein JW962_02745 [Candidatus Dojkabacteria bacterium]|nr:hypothetical protein [Candidatus Dojkabacteria bacterium]
MLLQTFFINAYHGWGGNDGPKGHLNDRAFSFEEIVQGVDNLFYERSTGATAGGNIFERSRYFDDEHVRKILTTVLQWAEDRPGVKIINNESGENKYIWAVDNQNRWGLLDRMPMEMIYDLKVIHPTLPESLFCALHRTYKLLDGNYEMDYAAVGIKRGTLTAEGQPGVPPQELACK